MNKMSYKRCDCPTLSEIGRMLEREGFVILSEGTYRQTEDNCLEIANRLSRFFGYMPFGSRKELTDVIFALRSQTLFGGDAHPRNGFKSPIALVVRSTDNPSDVHVALESYGYEYNFGPSCQNGFSIEMRIPLYKQ